MTEPHRDPRREAVALKYNATTDNAPKITAKGRGLVADKIIALAQAHGIPMREDPNLVQVLAQLDLHQEIPPHLYKVVAELLAFVYRLNQQYRSPAP
jgi:flagellar biosynthesis protein